MIPFSGFIYFEDLDLWSQGLSTKQWDTIMVYN